MTEPAHEPNGSTAVEEWPKPLPERIAELAGAALQWEIRVADEGDVFVWGTKPGEKFPWVEISVDAPHGTSRAVAEALTSALAWPCPNPSDPFGCHCPGDGPCRAPGDFPASSPSK